MKVLLDTCVWGGARTVLAGAGHEVEWTGSWESDPGDEQILSYAAKNSMILVTLDKDFGELAIVRGFKHSGIIRIIGMRAHEQGPAIVALLLKYESELLAGAIVTASAERVRIRPSDG